MADIARLQPVAPLPTITVEASAALETHGNRPLGKRSLQKARCPGIRQHTLHCPRVRMVVSEGYNEAARSPTMHTCGRAGTLLP